MPWAPGEAKKFNKRVTSSSQQSRWSAIANSVLAKTGDEGKAIRIANGALKPGAIKRRLDKKRSITGA